jgi:hypothetical protein
MQAHRSDGVRMGDLFCLAVRASAHTHTRMLARMRALARTGVAFAAHPGLCRYRRVLAERDGQGTPVSVPLPVLYPSCML